ARDSADPSNRSWRFDWSTNGAAWSTLFEGSLEGSAIHENIGTINQVGVFAGNQPSQFSAFTGLFDYYAEYLEEDEPLVAPSSNVAQAGVSSVYVTWSPVSGAVGYRLYRSTTAGGPYELVADVAAL